MKHFLHIGVGRLYNIGKFILEKKYYDYRRHWKFISDDNIQIWGCDCRNYSEEELALIHQSDWIDKFIHKDICDNWPEAPLFDLWDCVSVMEHVNKEDAQTFVKKLREKVTSDSTGYVHIDLSDHSKGCSSFDLFEDSDYAATYWDKNDGRYRMYLNRISGNKWKEYFSKQFSFDIAADEETLITLKNVRPINKD